jgi:three-Cys-motif partner protein
VPGVELLGIPAVDCTAGLRNKSVVSLCAGCGEPLDLDAAACRVCGEINATTDESVVAETNRIDPKILDELGEWSHVKHEIIEKYAHAYMTVMAKQRFKQVLYVDGFAGAGVAMDRDTGARTLGSAMLAVRTQPPFDELHFVEADHAKATALRQNTRGDLRVRVHEGDANLVLMNTILPRCRYEDYARALCLLDPYGLSVDWSLLCQIGQMRSVEIFFNFMVVGANRNVLWRRPGLVPPERLVLMDRVWGDRSWQDALYEQREDLFGLTNPRKLPNEQVAEAYRKRLRDVAGFAYVPQPVPMKNTRGATVYYLFFASPNRVGGSIVEDIFNQYRR